MFFIMVIFATFNSTAMRPMLECYPPSPKVSWFLLPLKPQNPMLSQHC